MYIERIKKTTITQISPVKRNEKITRENCGTQTRRSIFWRYTRCSTGSLHFIQTQFLHNLPDLPRFNSLVFSIEHWIMTPLSIDNIQVLLNNKTLLKDGNYSLAIKKSQSTIPAISTLAIYPLIFVASIECSQSTNLTGKNMYCTTF